MARTLRRSITDPLHLGVAQIAVAVVLTLLAFAFFPYDTGAVLIVTSMALVMFGIMTIVTTLMTRDTL